ncbi:MAG: hypothetical protein LLG02_07935 [Pelosinus sp.]|nr:hypothetical protein [Pelosinus sp.]
MEEINHRKEKCFCSFLKEHLHQRITLETASGAIITGTLAWFTCKIIRLDEVHIISVGGETIFLCYMLEKIKVITSWGIPRGNCPPFVNQQVVTGQITDSVTGEAVVGAFIRIVLIRDDKPIRVLGYTYSGCDGQYMFAFSQSLLLPEDHIQIQIVGPQNNEKEPYQCSP